ncbi:MAG: DUF951 domain-containing protein [Clostridia bacterium]|nr:DUF951 domain-containing protein [Clostridia bacterium]
MIETIDPGDVILTRKPHACGGSEWTVTRTGADIKMRCNTCGHVVMLDRERFLRRRKAVIRRGPASQIGQTEEHP